MSDQDEGNFRAVGLGFCYADFNHPTYEQGGSEFVPGLLIVDATFHLGWSGLADLVSPGQALA